MGSPKPLTPGLPPGIIFINTRGPLTVSAEETFAARAKNRFLASKQFAEADAIKANQPKVEARTRADKLDKAFILVSTFAACAALLAVVCSPVGWVALGLGAVALGILMVRHQILKREGLNTDTLNLIFFPLTMLYTFMKPEIPIVESREQTIANLKEKIGLLEKQLKKLNAEIPLLETKISNFQKEINKDPETNNETPAPSLKEDHKMLSIMDKQRITREIEIKSFILEMWKDELLSYEKEV